MVEVQYATATGWSVGHHGIELRDPVTYIRKLRARGVVARVFDLEEVCEHGCEAGYCVLG